MTQSFWPESLQSLHAVPTPDSQDFRNPQIYKTRFSEFSTSRKGALGKREIFFPLTRPKIGSAPDLMRKLAGDATDLNLNVQHCGVRASPLPILSGKSLDFGRVAATRFPHQCTARVRVSLRAEHDPHCRVTHVHVKTIVAESHILYSIESIHVCAYEER